MSPTILEPPTPAHQTGEQPVTITEKTRFSWPILVALITVALAAAGGVARATSAEECCRSATATQHQHDLRIQRTEDAQAAAADALREIKQELREINRKLDERRTP